MTEVWLALLSFVISLAISYWLMNPAARFFTVDQANQRSLHQGVVPQGGGIGIILAILAGGGWIALGAAELSWLALITLALLPVVVVSFLDDRAHISPVLRITIHLLAAVALVAGGLVPVGWQFPGSGEGLSEWAGLGLSLFGLVWMINLYNFMDGMDGFAGGMAVVGFAAFAILGALQGQTTFMQLNLCIAAAAGGFLALNFPPAQIFMGDVGSAPLGALAGAMMLWASHNAIFPLWMGVLIFSPFIADASVTLLRRVMRGERVWEAHHGHYYQRLVRLGWGHRRVVVLEYGLMLACAGSAITAYSWLPEHQWLLLSGWGIAYTLIFIMVHVLEAMNIEDVELT